MNDVNTQLGSGERLSFFKLFSEKKFKVEIPIIQRDYAQGRASEHEVRESFLSALYEYLKEGKPNRDLDFVYGSILKDEDSSRFIPLDGQQRLTTLFLLHWYLAQISNQSEVFRSVLCKKNKSQFSYETRTSSSEFCDALMACNIDILNPLNEGLNKHNFLSKTIQDKGWFYLSWNYDPTIQSMLTMLNSIHAKFSERPEFFQKLIDEERPVITFLFLNLHAFNLTDDLYIKMNARGKPLTSFENFKAKFEQRIKSFRNELNRYELGFSDKLVDGYEYFIHKIDTNWADIFWAYRNTLTKNDTYDDELMNFISLVIANYYLLGKSKTSGLHSETVNKFFGFGGKLRKLSFLEYDELDCFSHGFVEHLIQIMDLLYNKGLVDDKIKPYLNNRYYYSENEVFKKVIANNTNYQEKLRFYAFYTYLARGKDKAEMMEWMRVIYNLTENTIINTAEDYKRAIISIGELINKDESILDGLINGSDITAFSGAQVLEEKVKAHLIKKSKEWEKIIVGAEQHLFFRGQIGFALNFSGVLDFYRNNDGCDWDMSQNHTYFNAFKQYTNSGTELFTLIKSSSSAIDYLWERAVLSKGMYFTRTTANRWNMLSTRLSKNNIERDHSWKKLLRISTFPDAQGENRLTYVKAVFDDSDFDVNNIKDSLKIICNKAIEDAAIDDWRKAFIKYSALFKECNQGFIVKNKSNILLLHESQRNHYHSELFSRVLDLELMQKSEELLPFKQLPYELVKSREDSAYVSLGRWIYKNKEYNIEIWFNSDEYKLFFYGNEPQEYADELVSLLEEHEFEIAGNDYEEYGTSYLYGCKTQEELFEMLMDLCSGLRELVDE